MLGACLPETENKRIKSGPFRNLSGGRLRESYSVTEKPNCCLRSGRLREVVAYKLEVVAMREFTVNREQ